MSKKTGSGFEVLDGTLPPKFPLSALPTSGIHDLFTMSCLFFQVMSKDRVFKRCLCVSEFLHFSLLANRSFFLKFVHGRGNLFQFLLTVKHLSVDFLLVFPVVLFTSYQKIAMSDLRYKSIKS